MNIGIFTDTYEPQINGVVTSIKTLKKELESRGHNVYIFTTSDHDYKKDEGNVYRLASLPVIFSPQNRLAVMYSLKYSKIVKNLKLDIIHNQTEFSLGIFSKIISNNYHIPVVHTYHTMWEDYSHYISKRKNSKLTPMAIKLISKLFCDRFSTIIAPTEKTRQALITYGVKKPIVVVPTGVDLNPFKRSNFSEQQLADLRSTYGISTTDKVLIFIGRVAFEKSIDSIINKMPEVIKKNPTIKFVIVGDGAAKNGLVDLTSELGLEDNIIFTGKQPWENVPLFYNMADAFISASTSETQGLTFLEAMASGTPVIAKYDKNLDGFIEDKVNGRLFYKDSDITNVICEVLSSDSDRAVLSENALCTANNYSSEVFGEKMEGLYKDVIQKSYNTTE